MPSIVVGVFHHVGGLTTDNLRGYCSSDDKVTGYYNFPAATHVSADLPSMEDSPTPSK